MEYIGPSVVLISTIAQLYDLASRRTRHLTKMDPELVYMTMETFSGHLDEVHVIPVQLKDTLTLTLLSDKFLTELKDYRF